MPVKSSEVVPAEVHTDPTGGRERLEIHQSVEDALMLAGRSGDRFHPVLVETIRAAIRAGIPLAINSLDPENIRNKNLSEHAKQNLRKAWNEIDAA